MGGWIFGEMRKCDPDPLRSPRKVAKSAACDCCDYGRVNSLLGFRRVAAEPELSREKCPGLLETMPAQCEPLIEG